MIVVPHKRLLIAIVTTLVLGLASYSVFAADPTPPLGQPAPAPTPSSGEISSARAIASASMDALAGSQRWDVADARYAYRRVSSSTTKLDGIRMRATMESAVSSEGPWLYTTCQGRFLWRAAELSHRVRAIEIVADPSTGDLVAFHPVSVPNSDSTKVEDPVLDMDYLAKKATASVTDRLTGTMVATFGPGIDPAKSKITCPEGYNDD